MSTENGLEVLRAIEDAINVRIKSGLKGLPPGSYTIALKDGHATLVSQEDAERFKAPVKALDLANVMREAFLSGRGYKEGERITDADMRAWCEYEPNSPSLRRIMWALYRIEL